jgi:hypothetical protein
MQMLLLIISTLAVLVIVGEQVNFALAKSHSSGGMIFCQGKVHLFCCPPGGTLLAENNEYILVISVTHHS